MTQPTQAQIEDENSFSEWQKTYIKTRIAIAEKQAIERCAQVAENFLATNPATLRSEIAAAIRAMKDEK